MLTSRILKHFDYVKVARDAGLTEPDLTAIERGTRAEYGNDDMLFELRMFRTLNAIRENRTTVSAVLKELSANQSSAA